MPLTEAEEVNVKRRLLHMYMDTIATFRQLSQQIEFFFGEDAAELREAINEYLRDFIDEVDGEERIHPEGLIFRADRIALQGAGFYGAQLNLKERQVSTANRSLREAISRRMREGFKAPFKKWVSIINNFLGSLEVVGIGSALREIKDCLRDELPD